MSNTLTPSKRNVRSRLSRIFQESLSGLNSIMTKTEIMEAHPTLKPITTISPGISVKYHPYIYKGSGKTQFRLGVIPILITCMFLCMSNISKGQTAE